MSLDQSVLNRRSRLPNPMEIHAKSRVNGGMDGVVSGGATWQSQDEGMRSLPTSGRTDAGFFGLGSGSAV
jgi:hypothetical protein